MKLLLDTHAVLWYLSGNSLLSRRARSAIEDPANCCSISHATAWEVAIKNALGKLRLSQPYDKIFSIGVAANGWKFLPPDVRHYVELLDLPFHHRDPFDRLLIAQAKCEGLTIVTDD